jgi:putative aminopeptidase FrvX
MDATLELLKTLSETDGVSGYEHAVRAKMKEYLTPLTDEILRDRLAGS